MLIVFLIASVLCQDCCSYLQSQITRLESRLNDQDIKIANIQNENDELRQKFADLETDISFKYQLTRGNFSTRETIIFDKTVFDNSFGGYDSTTGVFTVPKSGKYMFIGYVWMNLIDGDTFKSLRLMINNRPAQYRVKCFHTSSTLRCTRILRSFMLR